MGVKNLFPFLGRVVPQCIRQVSIDELRGKTIAIDGTLLLYREYTSPWLPIAQPKKHILWAVRLLRLCRKHEILPIVIFDSPQTTPAKAKERVKRAVRKDRDKAALQKVQNKAARLDGLMGTMQAIEELDKGKQAEVVKQFQKSQTYRPIAENEPPELNDAVPESTSIVEERGIDVSDLAETQSVQEIKALVKRLVAHLKDVLDSERQDSAAELALLLKLLKAGSGIPLTELQDLQAQTAEILEKLSRRATFPSFKDVKATYEFLHKYRIPVQFSPDYFEGECTASYYTQAGYADYVATDDSDVLVYGVPQLRNFMSLRSTSRTEESHALAEMKVIDPAIMRAGISRNEAEPWTAATFLDFAILCGTDFTRGIAQFGVAKSHKAIDKHRNLEAGVKAIEKLTFKSGSRKGQQRFKRHDDFDSDATIARGIFTTFPEPSKLLNRLIAPGSSKSVYKRFLKLCRNTETWEALEAQTLKKQDMTFDDIKVLDDDALYRQSNSNLAATIAYGTIFNDDPDRPASDDTSLRVSASLRPTTKKSVPAPACL